MKDWIGKVEQLLIEKLKPSKLIIDDTTLKHKNHAGHDPLKKHLKIQINSCLFREKSKVEQHRMVLEVLKPLLKTTLHSVTIVTNPSEL